MRWFVLISGTCLLLCTFGGGCASERDESDGGLACEARGSDDDCLSQGMPQKFNCETAAQQRSGFALGCVREHADEADDFDLCCPDGVQSNFSEGFCSPFRNGASFDLSTCAEQGDPLDLEDPEVSRATLDGWSCDEFDQHE
jgi:hypothetical protein